MIPFQDGIPRLTDLVYHGENWNIFLSGNCPCVKSMREHLSLIEKKFFWGNRQKYFHVALVTTPIMAIYIFKKRLISRKKLAEILCQEIPDGISIFSMSDDSIYVESEREILAAMAEEEKLKNIGVIGQ